jgi:hypothetical protein
MPGVQLTDRHHRRRRSHRRAGPARMPRLPLVRLRRRLGPNQTGAPELTVVGRSVGAASRTVSSDESLISRFINAMSSANQGYSLSRPLRPAPATDRTARPTHRPDTARKRHETPSLPPRNQGFMTRRISIDRPAQAIRIHISSSPASRRALGGVAPINTTCALIVCIRHLSRPRRRGSRAVNRGCCV